MEKVIVFSITTLVLLLIFVSFFIKTTKSSTKVEYRKNANITILFGIITTLFAVSTVLISTTK